MKGHIGGSAKGIGSNKQVGSRQHRSHGRLLVRWSTQAEGMMGYPLRTVGHRKGNIRRTCGRGYFIIRVHLVTWMRHS